MQLGHFIPSDTIARHLSGVFKHACVVLIVGGIIGDILLYALPSQRLADPGGQPLYNMVMASVNRSVRHDLLFLGGTFGFQELLGDVYGKPADEVALEDTFYDICLDGLVENDIPRSLVIACTTVAEVRGNF